MLTADGETAADLDTFPCQIKVFKVKAAWKFNQKFLSEMPVELKAPQPFFLFFFFTDFRHII